MLPLLSGTREVNFKTYNLLMMSLDCPNLKSIFCTCLENMEKSKLLHKYSVQECFHSKPKMLVTKAGKGEDLGTEGNTPSINGNTWLKHSQHSFATICPHLMPCLAAPKFKLILLALTVQQSLSVTLSPQTEVCLLENRLQKILCYEFQTCFFSKKIAFINILSNKQKSEVNYKYLPALLSLAGGEKLPTEAQRRCEHDFVFNPQTFHYSHSSVRDFLI